MKIDWTASWRPEFTLGPEDIPDDHARRLLPPQHSGGRDPPSIRLPIQVCNDLLGSSLQAEIENSRGIRPSDRDGSF